MKILLVLLVVVLIVSFYLNRIYAHFYDSRGDLLPKTTDTVYKVGDGARLVKLAVIGDSLSAGVGVKKGEDSYPYILAEKMSQKGVGVLLYDFAEPGVETKHVLDTQVKSAISRNPDIILILIGINDMHNLVSDNKFKENYLEIIKEIKSKTNSSIYLISIPYLGSNKIAIFPFNFWIAYKTGVYNQIIENLAEEENVGFLDLYANTKSKFDSSEYLYSSDHFHPSYEGYILWGQFINANINP